MEEVGAYEAKTHLPALLRKVKEGKCFQITVRGVPVAQLVPIGEKSREQSKLTVARMKRFMQEAPQLKVSSADLRGYRGEGRD